MEHLVGGTANRCTRLDHVLHWRRRCLLLQGPVTGTDRSGDHLLRSLPISATFLLGQLPSIRKRMSLPPNAALRIEPGNDFYQNPAWEKSRGDLLKLGDLATLQHWL